MFNPFDIEGSVRSTLWDALKQASKISGVHVTRKKIKICSPDGSGKLIFHLLDGGKQITTYCEQREVAIFTDSKGKETVIDLHKLMNSPVDIMGTVRLSLSLLTNVVSNMAFKHEVPLHKADFRIYTHDEQAKEPKMSLVIQKSDDVRDVQVINFTMEEIINAGNTDAIMTNMAKESQGG